MKPYFQKVFLVLSIVFLGGGVAGGTEQSKKFIVSGQMPLKGTLLFPFGHREMPGLVFNAVYKNDFPELTKIHTSGPLETVNRLLLGKADHALLAEPAATMAQAKSGVDGQPVLTKHLNLGKAWEEKFNGRPLYVSALSLFVVPRCFIWAAN